MQVIALDFETIEIMPDGSHKPSLDFYKPTFRVSSCAVARYDGDTLKTKYVVGEHATRLLLQSLAKDGHRVIAHNEQFDAAVALCRFPDIKLNWYADSMRLCQLYDNGGEKWVFAPVDPDDIEDADDEDDIKANPIHGLRLSACVKRILCDYTDHKEVAYAGLRSRGVAAGEEAANLHLLTPEEMEAYNVGDAVACLRLYKFITTEFTSQGYDWSTDNMLFQFMLQQLIRSKIAGVDIDRVQAQRSADQVASEIISIRQAFAEKMADPIKAVERMLLNKRLLEYKTEKGRQKFVESGVWKEECQFNPGSNLQLKMLFVDVLGMEAKFHTPKKQPSFKSIYLPNWGDGGIILQLLKKRGLVLAQLNSLLDLSEYDNKWHLDLKLCGTSTGRMAGGSYE